jgi:hypothetical protein
MPDYTESIRQEYSASSNAKRIAQEYYGRLRRLKIADLRVDPNYQRPPDRAKIALMAQKRKNQGAVLVNRRGGDEYYIVDGQHRAAAMLWNHRLWISAWVLQVPVELEAVFYAELNEPDRFEESADPDQVLFKAAA